MTSNVEAGPPPSISFGGLLAGTFAAYGRGWADFWLVAAIGMVPLAMISVAAGVFFDVSNKAARWTADVNARPPADMNEFMAGFAPVLVALLEELAVLVVASVILGSLVYAALVKATDDLLETDSVSVAAAYKAAGRALLPMLAIYLVLGLVSMLPLLVFFFLTRLSIAPQVVVLERRGPLAALGRSWRLTNGNFFPIFWTLLALAVINAIGGQLISAPAGFFRDALMRDAASSLLSALALVALLPLLAIATTIVHFGSTGRHAPPPTIEAPRLRPAYAALKIALDGRLFLNGKPVPPADVEPLLGELAAGGHQLPVFLEAPELPPSAAEQAVLDQLAAAGVRIFPGEQAPAQWGQLQSIEAEVAPMRFKFSLERAQILVGEEGRLLRQGDIAFAAETQLLKSIGLLVTANRVLEAPGGDAEQAFSSERLKEPSVHLRLGFAGGLSWKACYAWDQVPGEVWSFLQGLHSAAAV
ncbi:MAG TPA: hypothetical protein VF134_04630 [Candidatus Dormibacteraeota bacterium]